MPNNREKGFHIRLGLVFFMALLGFLAIAGRLVQLQVLRNETLDSLSKRQFKKIKTVSPYRRPILDRNGEELAVNITAGSIFARPRLIKNKHLTAKKLAQFLGGNSRAWYQKLASARGFVWIRRQVDEPTSQKIEKAKLRGVYVSPERKRLYPNGSLASSLIGFTDIDGRGLAGVEFQKDDELVLEESKSAIYRDGRGKTTYLQREELEESVKVREGIALTIDRHLQFVVEEALENARQKFEAKSVMAIVMDPFTGEILAMSHRPSFNPNSTKRSANQDYSNPLVSHLFEPGSTLKVLFAAEALERGLMSEGTTLDCGNGMIKIGIKTITEAGSTHRFSQLPLEKVIQVSSNVGAVNLVRRLGQSTVIATLDRFGLLQKTDISLPGEALAPPKKNSDWNPLLTATTGFGQGVSFTPLQMVRAFSVFANGGYLVKPKIFLSEIEAHQQPIELKHILSTATTLKMKKILVSVTEGEHGTGKLAKVEGLHVAGKTGTAQKYDPKEGYAGGKYFSSFLGFLPAEKPQLIIGVWVDEPKKQYYASEVAAPLFSEIAQKSIHILGKIPQQTIARNVSTSPVVITPPKTLSLKPDEDGTFLMPELTGLSLRETLRSLGSHFKNIEYNGEGYVVAQIPTSGTKIDPDSKISLQLSPSNPPEKTDQ